MINDSFEFSSIECDFPIVNLKYRYTEYEMESYEVNEEMKLKTLPEVEAPINDNEGFKGFRDEGYTFIIEYLDKNHQKLFSFFLRKSSNGLYKIVELKKVNGKYDLVEIGKNEWNKFHEIEFEKPEGWFNITDKPLKDLIEEVAYSESTKEYMLNRESENLLVSRFTKYEPENYEGYIPGVQIVKRDNPYSNYKDFKNAIIDFGEEFKTILNNYKLESAVNDVRLDGLNGYTFKYSYEIPLDNEMIKVNNWIYIVPIGKYFYQIDFVDTESDNCYQLFNSFSKSIKFKKSIKDLQNSLDLKYDITNNPSYQKMKKENIDRLMEKAKIELKNK